MWFYIPVAFLLVLGLAGGVFMGGIFTLALVPLGLVAAVSVVGVAVWDWATQRRAGAETEAVQGPSRPRARSKPDSSDRRAGHPSGSPRFEASIGNRPASVQGRVLVRPR